MFYYFLFYSTIAVCGSSLYKQLGLMIYIRISADVMVFDTLEWTSTLFPVLYWNTTDYTSDLNGTHYNLHTISKVKKKLNFQEKLWSFIRQNPSTKKLKID